VLATRGERLTTHTLTEVHMAARKSDSAHHTNARAASPISLSPCPGLDKALSDAQAAMSRLAAAARVQRDALRGMAWWNNLPIGERRYWLLVTRGGSAAECWEA
jgi:hypothetical protein